MKRLTATFSGYLLLLSLAMSLLSAIGHLFDSYWAGIPIWLATFLFFPHLKSSQKKQVILLLSLGIIGLVYGSFHQLNTEYVLRAIAANQMVVTMLVGVGFLKLFATEPTMTEKPLPIGKRSLIKTLVGVHLFGSVLNMSSVLIVGDKLAHRGPVTVTQGVTLLRGFAICAFWSPFFAAMGMALTNAPGAQLSTLIMYGIPTSIAALFLSAWDIVRQPNVDKLAGYPINIYSLWMPALLATIVIVAHLIWPNISVLSLVSLTSLVFIGLWLALNEGRQAITITKDHIHSGIARSAGEVTLFASAAMLAAGVATLLSSLDLKLAPQHFGAMAAVITLLILIILAVTGMHPVTSVVIAGSILAPSVTDPNLLGLTLLMGWSLGITLSPFSGVQLSIQSRYHISSYELFKHNWRYVLFMYGVCVMTLSVYAHLNA
ncbi:hypothetical protein [Vibrio palustris]|uniref:Uncharacterized protein n=1 Tax=Vibrio palustris TaxID=1918946 RepID=A0A1R4B5X6_9VIBR|nr:hypothetical protein [Vibrio palustris]SJL84324.1 hypothetical protein VPAL9027_02306 [Vibrio palustris]